MEVRERVNSGSSYKAKTQEAKGKDKQIVGGAPLLYFRERCILLPATGSSE